MTTSAEELPWWASASVEELTMAEGVVADFIRGGEAPGLEETMRFARALALETLCVRPTALDQAIETATALTDSYRAWISQGAAKAERADPTGWVKRSPSVRHGFELCLSMLPHALAFVAAAKMKEFSELSEALEDADRDSYFLDGTRTPFTVSRTLPPPKPQAGGLS
jgi:hypothetical protein